MDRATRTAWRLALVGVVLLMLAAGFIGTACPPAPTPDYADSLASARHRYAADSAAWRVTVAGLQAVADSAIRESRTAKAEAQRLRARRAGQLVRVAYTSDSTLMVPKADFDSLAAEADSLWSVVRADSVALEATYARIRADSTAYATLASLRASEGASYQRQIDGLTRDLVKARRGSCVLGLIPTPSIGVGYGATLVNGAVATGPVIAVTIPLRGCG